MSKERPSNPPSHDCLTFFQEFLKHPLQIGSVIPSSRFLEQRLLKSSDLGAAGTLVELGSGTGGTTQAILRSMAPTARLLSIEVNPEFHRVISRINDARLIAHHGNASELKDILSRYDLGAPEVIISGIPFSTMSPIAGSTILATIADVLSNHGRFVAYQVSNRILSLCEPFMGMGQMEFELFNIPPMRVFRWEKQVI